ncbi:transcript variant X5 [Nothobranchius furzeri]|uniref:Centrosomal protein 43 n=1 Tax=Nothobranchius furzeri TaxID=105023 RepID=A0A9D3C6Y0_NOTFU|nr:transcript variant X5 [Nothobranchius furzeri]
MSAAEDDTELRDLLIQNLENSGVLNKLKAEMRAAVFLAMEDQDRLENKSPLVNENLNKCLNSKDGRLVASLIMDFLQVFNLDFSLAVFQPEINSLNGLDSRELVCRELGLSDSEQNQNSPLLLELIRRNRHGDKRAVPTKVRWELSQEQMADARKWFEFYDKDQSGSVSTEVLTSVFSDLFPNMNKNMLERFVCDELRAVDRNLSGGIDFQAFLGMCRHLFSQCRSVVVLDPDLDVSPPQNQIPEDKVGSPPVSQIPRYKVQKSPAAAKELERASSLGQPDLQQSNNRTASSAVRKESLDLEGEEDHDEGDSFFDDPLPEPQKTYGCQNSPRGEKDLSEWTGTQEKVETPGVRGSPVGSQSEGCRLAGGGGGSSGSEPSRSRNGASNSREKGFRGLSDRTGSLHLDDDVEYDDDFNSHRSDLSNGELSIGEEIEEVSIEGPENSDKFDESTQDLSVSQLSQSNVADYMEDVS